MSHRFWWPIGEIGLPLIYESERFKFTFIDQSESRLETMCMKLSLVPTIKITCYNPANDTDTNNESSSNSFSFVQGVKKLEILRV